jgi:PAS domain S-box-containing protein
MKLETPKKILIIDDDNIIRDVLAEYLKKKNYQVMQADNGFDGLSLYVSEKPDLVFVDIIMPEMSGLEFTEKLLEMNADAVIIVISGTGCMMDPVKALKIGAWDFIFKPIQDFVLLDHAVSRAFEQAKMKKEKKAFEQLLKEQIRQRTDELEKINNRLLQEIEKHKKTETILAAKENHYRGIFENAPVGIFQTTHEGKFIDANPALANMFGYDSPNELIETVNQSSIAYVLYEHPDIRKQTLEKAFEKKDWITVETKFRHKQGTLISINLIFKFEWDDSGQTKYLTGFVEKRTNE